MADASRSQMRNIVHSTIQVGSRGVEEQHLGSRLWFIIGLRISFVEAIKQTSLLNMPETPSLRLISYSEWIYSSSFERLH